MPRTVIAILLDACEPAWLERWLDAGDLPAFASLREQSARFELHGVHPFTGELPIHALLTSTQPARAGYWGAFNYDPANYQPLYLRAYDYRNIRNFYDYTPGLKVCQFDLPKAGLASVADGIQVLNWGAHGSLNDAIANPPDLYGELAARYGVHPALEQDHIEPWQTDALDTLFERLRSGVALRTRIHRDLLARRDWDLFLTSYSEVHSAGHCYMHRDNPAFDRLGASPVEDHVRALARDIDRSVGDLIAAAPDADIALFSIHGMVMNGWDIGTMFFLPELLHRMAFPERIRRPNGALPPATVGSWYWADKVWEIAFGEARAKPAMAEGINWIPASWYAADWRRMKAFALPGLDEGMIRLNLRGRDPDGIVPPAEYERTLAWIAETVSSLHDARTGEPLVRRFYRTRTDPFADGPDLPPADLIVEWHYRSCDVADSPLYGRIGPVPLRRTGGHSRNGFAWFRHARFEPGDRGTATPFDIGPTLLDMIGTAIPGHFDGRSLLSNGRRGDGGPLFPVFAPDAPSMPTNGGTAAMVRATG
jgi:predicted AlkP superfamily phosphohydrolase/phosphomutase